MKGEPGRVRWRVIDEIRKWFCLGFCLFVAQKAENFINEGMKKELKKN